LEGHTHYTGVQYAVTFFIIGSDYIISLLGSSDMHSVK